jgi:hypothetical protein
LILQFHWICILRTWKVSGKTAPYSKCDSSMADVTFFFQLFLLPSPLSKMLLSPHDWCMYIFIFPTTPNTFSFKQVHKDLTIKRAVSLLWYSCTL